MAPTVVPALPGSAVGLRRPQLDRGTGRTALIVCVWLLAVAGVGGVTWLAALAGDPGGAVVTLVLALLPVPLLVAGYRWLDGREPEPVRFVAAALLWGAVVSTAVAGSLQWLLEWAVEPTQRQLAVVAAPISEELLKGLLVVLVVLRRRKVAGAIDGIVYAGLVGVGFAFSENLLYYTGAYSGSLVPDYDGATAATSVFAMRGLVSPFAHPLFTTATGVGIVVAVTTTRRWLAVVAPVAGFASAVCLHAAWNGSTLLWSGLGFPIVYFCFMVPLLGTATYLAFRAYGRQGEVVRRALGDAAGRGWLHPAEIHWLVRAGDRAAARRFARQVAGKPAATAVRAYQRSAAELALMHDRVLRGRAPVDGISRVCAHLRRMHSWRPFLVLPPLPWTPPGSAPGHTWDRAGTPLPDRGRLLSANGQQHATASSRRLAGSDRETDASRPPG